VREQLHVHSDDCRYSCDIRRSECPYSCELCNKVFSQQSSLISHHCIHNVEHPYTCDVCNKAFIQQSSLITHEHVCSEHVFEILFKL
jgi:hypothetical protein